MHRPLIVPLGALACGAPFGRCGPGALASAGYPVIMAAGRRK